MPLDANFLALDARILKEAERRHFDVGIQRIGSAVHYCPFCIGLHSPSHYDHHKMEVFGNRTITDYVSEVAPRPDVDSETLILVY